MEQVVDALEPVEVGIPSIMPACRSAVPRIPQGWPSASKQGTCMHAWSQIEHPVSKQLHRFWLENPAVSKPVKEDAAAGADQRLFPRECREAVRAASQSHRTARALESTVGTGR